MIEEARFASLGAARRNAGGKGSKRSPASRAATAFARPAGGSGAARPAGDGEYREIADVLKIPEGNGESRPEPGSRPSWRGCSGSRGVAL